MRLSDSFIQKQLDANMKGGNSTGDRAYSDTNNNYEMLIKMEQDGSYNDKNLESHLNGDLNYNMIRIDSLKN